MANGCVRLRGCCPSIREGRVRVGISEERWRFRSSAHSTLWPEICRCLFGDTRCASYRHHNLGEDIMATEKPSMQQGNPAPLARIDPSWVESAIRNKTVKVAPAPPRAK